MCIYHYSLKKMDSCYTLNVYHPTQPICWNPNSQCEGVSMHSLWEGIRSHGWNPYQLDKIKPRELSFPICHEVTESGLWTRKWAPTRLNLPVSWSGTCQPLELWEINVCGLSHPVHSVLLEKSELTKMTCSKNIMIRCIFKGHDSYVLEAMW